MNLPRYKRPESVLVVIYTDTNQVLLLERLYPAEFWQSVTGSLEWAEDPLQAALREVKEETGLDVGACLQDCEITNRFPILPAWRSRYAPGVDENIEYVFRAECPAGSKVSIDPNEHRSFRWLSRNDASKKVSSETNRHAILRLASPL